MEDVICIEGDSAILFSVKSTLVQASAARQALSARKTLDWFELFSFAKKGPDWRGGAIRLLDSKIARIRSGEFERHGVGRDLTIYPVVVTFDSLGEHDLLYRWLEHRCRAHGVLRQAAVANLTIAGLGQFEQLLGRLAEGRSATGVLHARQGSGRNRPLAQLLHEDGLPERLPLFKRDHDELFARMLQLFQRPEEQTATTSVVES